MRFMRVLFLLPIAVFAASVVETFDAPDTGITGLAYDGGSLWAVDGTTQYVYEINPSKHRVCSRASLISTVEAVPYTRRRRVHASTVQLFTFSEKLQVPISTQFRNSIRPPVQQQDST
jgi:hypothetical protein